MRGSTCPHAEPEHPEVAGDLWAVHGGGFYHAQKYKVAPAELPEPLHWFKWEAYFTWMTGFALFVVVYYLNAEAMLMDPAVLPISGSEDRHHQRCAAPRRLVPV